jgi:hypothetical protein
VLAAQSQQALPVLSVAVLPLALQQQEAQAPLLLRNRGHH